MRVTARHAVLLVALLTVFLVAVDSATAAEIGTQQVDCWTSPGGAYEVCY